MGEVQIGRRIKGLDAGQRRAQRRQQLLDAALELFARQGYAQTSIEQICQTAYVGTKGFYELFTSKEACYLDLLRQIADQTLDQLATRLAAAPADADQAAHELIATFAHALADDPRMVRVAFGEGAGISPAVDRQRRANRRRGAAFVESVWSRYGVGRAAEEAGVDLHRAAVGLIGGLFDLVVDWLLGLEQSNSPPTSETAALIDDLIGFYQLVRIGLDAPR